MQHIQVHEEKAEYSLCCSCKQKEAKARRQTPVPSKNSFSGQAHGAALLRGTGKL